MTDLDLFGAAMAARDRNIARLEGELAEARARIVELERRRVPVVGDGDVLLLPSSAWSGFIGKEAARALDALNPREHAPRYVERVLNRVRAYRAKAGVSDVRAIEADVDALRAALWREIARLWSMGAGEDGPAPTTADNGGGAA